MSTAAHPGRWATRSREKLGAGGEKSSSAWGPGLPPCPAQQGLSESVQTSRDWGPPPAASRSGLHHFITVPVRESPAALGFFNLS